MFCLALWWRWSSVNGLSTGLICWRSWILSPSKGYEPPLSSSSPSWRGFQSSIAVRKASGKLGGRGGRLMIVLRSACMIQCMIQLFWEGVVWERGLFFLPKMWLISSQCLLSTSPSLLLGILTFQPCLWSFFHFGVSGNSDRTGDVHPPTFGRGCGDFPNPANPAAARYPANPHPEYGEDLQLPPNYPAAERQQVQAHGKHLLSLASVGTWRHLETGIQLTGLGKQMQKPSESCCCRCEAGICCAQGRLCWL